MSDVDVALVSFHFTSNSCTAPAKQRSNYLVRFQHLVWSLVAAFASLAAIAAAESALSQLCTGADAHARGRDFPAMRTAAIPPGLCYDQTSSPLPRTAVSEALIPSSYRDGFIKQCSCRFRGKCRNRGNTSRSDGGAALCMCFGFSHSLLFDNWRTACNVHGHVANYVTTRKRSRNRRSRRKIGRSMGAGTSARRSRGESRSWNHLRSARSLLCRFKRRGSVANLEQGRCEVYH